jgi:hypothetical protein
MKTLAIAVRWAARTIGALIVVLFFIMLFAEGLPSDLTSAEQVMFATLAVMILGVVLAWKWEWLGGLLTFIGFAGFWYTQGRFPHLTFALFPLAGILHIAAWLFDRKPAGTN